MKAMGTVFFIIFVAFIVIAIGLRFRWTFGKKSFKELARYVKEETGPNTLASFICSTPREGNVGLFFSTNNIRCSDQEYVVFDIKPEDLERVEYSNRNFFRFVTKGNVYKISYLHEVKEGESLVNNVLMAPNLSYTDPEATQKLIAALDSLHIEHIKRPHTKVLFFPYQGSPSVLGFMALIIITFLLFLLVSK
jgi:hypothetical protein